MYQIMEFQNIWKKLTEIKEKIHNWVAKHHFVEVEKKQ